MSPGELGDLLRTLLWGYPPAPEMLDPRFPEAIQRVGGLSLAVIIAALAMAGGLVLGIMLALCRRETPPLTSSHWRFVDFSWRGLSLLAAALVETIRGLPIMVLALLVFYLPYPLTGTRLPGVVLAIIAFSLYAGAYSCEIIRAGLRSFPVGLREAGRVLGLRPGQIFLKIEMPLVVRNMLPDVVNLAVTVFKDTSVLAVTGVAELTYTGRLLFMDQPHDYGVALLLTMLLYWLPAALLARWLANAGPDMRMC